MKSIKSKKYRIIFLITILQTLAFYGYGIYETHRKWPDEFKRAYIATPWNEASNRGLGLYIEFFPLLPSYLDYYESKTGIKCVSILRDVSAAQRPLKGTDLHFNGAELTGFNYEGSMLCYFNSIPIGEIPQINECVTRINEVGWPMLPKKARDCLEIDVVKRAYNFVTHVDSEAAAVQNRKNHLLKELLMGIVLLPIVFFILNWLVSAIFVSTKSSVRKLTNWIKEGD